MKTMTCPLCGATAHEKIEDVVVSFREQKYRITSHSFVCEKCNEDFSTEEQLAEALAQIPNSPWSKEL